MRILTMLAVLLLQCSAAHAAESVRLTYGPEDLASQYQQKTLSNSVAAALTNCRSVSISFRTGTYVAFQLFVDVRKQPDGCRPRLDIAAVGDGKVIFDGAGGPQFLGLVTSKTRFPGSASGFTVRNYINGISLTGKAGAASTGQSGFVIRNNQFQSLGGTSMDATTKIKGWGAIVLRGAGENSVEENRFSGLGNAVESELMHAVYLENSSGNMIERNDFGAMDGAVIKLRARSNSNRISNNRFHYEGDALVQDWFCNIEVRGARACPLLECPSQDNAVTENIVVADGMRDPGRRGGGAAPVTNPYVAYATVDGVKMLESYYDAATFPKGCTLGDNARIKGLQRNTIAR